MRTYIIQIFKDEQQVPGEEGLSILTGGRTLAVRGNMTEDEAVAKAMEYYEAAFGHAPVLAHVEHVEAEKALVA